MTLDYFINLMNIIEGENLAHHFHQPFLFCLISLILGVQY